MTWAEAIKAELLRKGLGDDYSSCDLPGCWHSNDPNLVEAAVVVWRQYALRAPRGFEARGLTREIKATPARLPRSGITGKPRWTGLVAGHRGAR